MVRVEDAKRKEKVVNIDRIEKQEERKDERRLLIMKMVARMFNNKETHAKTNKIMYSI